MILVNFHFCNIFSKAIDPKSNLTVKVKSVKVDNYGNVSRKVKNLSKTKNIKSLNKFKKPEFLKINQFFEIIFFNAKIRLAFI